ncbi:MAG: DUF4339 domain-containing protein [Candidatus Hydrogenedentota bacterium]|nr:MAG: DUF4339 domain-containing protein [Candidatus Hydrogenedentota bacterium]
MSEPHQYYIYLNNEIVGPLPAEAVRARKLDPNTYVCPAGTEEWVLLADIGELLPEPDATSSLPSPLVGSGAEIDITEKKKIFIIHGRGNTMHQAFGKLTSLLRCKLRYYQMNYYVDSENSEFTRYILYDAHSNPFLALIDKILAGKLVLSPLYPPPPDWVPDKSWTKLSEFKVSDKLGLYGAPMGTLEQKKVWVDRLYAQVYEEMGRRLNFSATLYPAFVDHLERFRDSLRPPDGGLYLEREYKDALRKAFSHSPEDGEAFIECLLELQRLGDAGGDLDTIASNALYGAWILQAWEAKYGSPPRYGRDFEFDFVNYHQSFLHLARHRNCEVYLPDFPMDAIPDLEEAARALVENGSFFVRIDDHHPMAPEKYELLENLKRNGLIGDYVMSGPLKGEEQPPEERTCGADLIHAEMLKKRGFDSPGLEELRRLAHQQDLHFIEDPDDRTHPDYLAIDLSKLIGSKHSRIDMAQQLMFVRSYEDMRNIMETTGWRAVVDRYEADLEKVLPKLEACIAAIEFVDPTETNGAAVPAALKGFGRIIKALSTRNIDLEALWLRYKGGAKPHRILLTLAPFQSRKEHRINVASAINYMKRFFRFDYFFYAWGANLLTTRRFNDTDQSLDLSTLMPILGGPGDGGHSSAATCKPPSNPRWPAEKFARLKKDNFLDYARYIADRIAEGTGKKIVSVRLLNRSTDADFPA